MHWNNGIHWDITFSKAFHDWELEILTSFLDLIYSIKIKGNGEDRMCWMPTRSSMFEVKSFYRAVFLIRLLFSLGWWLRVRFLLLTICAVVGFGCWIGALCAKRLVNL